MQWGLANDKGLNIGDFVFLIGDFAFYFLYITSNDRVD